ncbi:uncharacterized protein LOC133302990, partial [Gastrolobium bilobum]|uniref:uncharacterized protein LOC133302990 n=1 Tax=Gastrolobium bilobum TaxID=150636 RepID=UPI002AAF4188
AFDLHKVICHTSSDNEQKAETETEAQKLETTVTKHPKLEGETTEINPTNGPKEHEKVPASHSGEKLEIEDDAEFIHEEAKEMEEATDMHLRKTATASVPNDEDRSTLPTSAIVKGETVEEILQQQTLQEEESAAIGIDKSCRPGNELEEKNKAVEVRP